MPDFVFWNIWMLFLPILSYETILRSDLGYVLTVNLFFGQAVLTGSVLMLKCSFLKCVCPLLLTVCFCAEHTRQWVPRPRVGAVPTSHRMKRWSKATATEEAWLINKLSVLSAVQKNICCSESIFIAQCRVLSPMVVSDQAPWNKQPALVFHLSSDLRQILFLPWKNETLLLFYSQIRLFLGSLQHRHHSEEDKVHGAVRVTMSHRGTGDLLRPQEVCHDEWWVGQQPASYCGHVTSWSQI